MPDNHRNSSTFFRRLFQRRHQCPATVVMMGRTYECERFRGHYPEMHYSLMGRLNMVQWPEGWQG